MHHRHLAYGLCALLSFWCHDLAHGASNADYAALPPTLPALVDPNVMLNLSIETPMQGAAYNDQPNGALCGGRINDGGTVGVCYAHENEYIGYFDPDKCYSYTNSRFEPAALATSHQCSGQWSGNFLNWATMTAIDEFRWALTGGNRSTDTTALTVLERSNMGLGKGDSWYPVKMISSTQNVAPSTVTPYTNSKIYLYNHGTQFDIGTSWGGSEKVTNLNARVMVCDSGISLEDNCIPYGNHHKPQGLIQNNAYRMRFALMSYTRDDGKSRDGGVLRANMKYVGPLRPASGGGPGDQPSRRVRHRWPVPLQPGSGHPDRRGLQLRGDQLSQQVRRQRLQVLRPHRRTVLRMPQLFQAPWPHLGIRLRTRRRPKRRLSGPDQLERSRSARLPAEFHHRHQRRQPLAGQTVARHHPDWQQLFRSARS
ncbi:MAG: hypothetical protein HQM02_05125, partial [Magnetococcales bacterium]|nr:hypothetical protein [Magnetococcales bacterium]